MREVIEIFLRPPFYIGFISMVAWDAGSIYLPGMPYKLVSIPAQHAAWRVLVYSYFDPNGGNIGCYGSCCDLIMQILFSSHPLPMKTWVKL